MINKDLVILGLQPRRQAAMLGVNTIEHFHMTSRRLYWCSKTMKWRPYWCTQKILWELNSFLV